jgi:hypothetical protein
LAAVDQYQFVEGARKIPVYIESWHSSTQLRIGLDQDGNALAVALHVRNGINQGVSKPGSGILIE